MKRSISDVIDRLLVEIPPGRVGLRDAIVWIKDSAYYTAPEQMIERWRELTNALNATLPYPPETAWQRRVLEIITGAPS
jgi:hypothetical protein